MYPQSLRANVSALKFVDRLTMASPARAGDEDYDEGRNEESGPGSEATAG